MILPKVGNRCIIRGQLPEQPQPLDIALALPLKEAAGADAMEVAVERYLQQITGMLGGTTGCSSNHALEAKLLQIKRIYKGIAKADRMLLGDILI